MWGAWQVPAREGMDLPPSRVAQPIAQQVSAGPDHTHRGLPKSGILNKQTQKIQQTELHISLGVTAFWRGMYTRSYLAPERPD